MKPFENKSQDCEVKDTKLVKKKNQSKNNQKTKNKKPTTKTKKQFGKRKKNDKEATTLVNTQTEAWPVEIHY